MVAPSWISECNGTAKTRPFGTGSNYQGTFTYDSTTVIAKNHATTSNDNVWP